MQKHGLSKTRAYNAWVHMMRRCYNPADQRFKHYGGRGIAVCERWHDPTAFVQDMGEPAFGLSIERRDNDQPYCPENCLWIKRGDQSKNRRYNRSVVVDGETLTAAEASRRLGIKSTTLLHRIDQGISGEALKARVGIDIPFTVGDVTRNLGEWAVELGIPKSTIYARRRRGWPSERWLEPR
jgi:hypothetical protein